MPWVLVPHQHRAAWTWLLVLKRTGDPLISQGWMGQDNHRRDKHSTGTGAAACRDKPVAIPGDMPHRTPESTQPEPSLSHGMVPGDTGCASPVREDWAETSPLYKGMKMLFAVFWEGFFSPFVFKREDCRSRLSQEICYNTSICLSWLSHPSIDPKDELPWISLMLFFMFPQADEYLWIISPEPKHGPYNWPW